MKSPLFITLMLLSSIKIVSSQVPVIQWERSLGGSGSDYGLAIRTTSDNGIIAVGNTTSHDGDLTFNHGNSDCWVVKLDESGTLQWQKTYGGSLDEGANAVKQTADHGYIIAGYSDSDNGDVTGNHGTEDFWVFKIDSTGNLQWENSFGGSGDDVATSVLQMNDGGYLVAGHNGSSDGDVIGNHGGFDDWVIKLDANGSLQWQKSFGGSGDEEGWSLTATTDNSFLLGGYSTSNDDDVTGNHGIYDYWVVKIDLNGNLLWQKSLGGSNFDWSFGVCEDLDQGVIVTGLCASTDGDVTGNHGSNDMWIAKLDDLGNLQWQKSLGGSLSDGGATIFPYNDGYLIGGVSFSSDGDVSNNYGIDDFWLVAVDATGNLDWEKSFGGSGVEAIAYSCLDEAGSGELYLGGTSASDDNDVSGNHGAEDFWIVKLSTTTGTSSLPSHDQLLVYPTVTSGIVKIFSGNRSGTLTVINAIGQKIFSEVISEEDFFYIDFSKFSAGLYTIALMDQQNKMYTAKIINR